MGGIELPVLERKISGEESGMVVGANNGCEAADGEIEGAPRIDLVLGF